MTQDLKDIEVPGNGKTARRIVQDLHEQGQHGYEIVIPIRLKFSVDTSSLLVDRSAIMSRYQSPVADVTAKVPAIVRDYTDRTGYAEDFLGVNLELPKVNEDVVAAMEGTTDYVIPYEHFSIVMHAERRMPLVTASNVNGKPEKRKPEPGDYTRAGLGQTGGGSETWILDSRLSPDYQLTDNFYNKDRKAFDKGHVVRREDVCWGDSYAQVQKANGDTFHVTNCTPQVSDFNQASKDGIWGQLEELILKQAKKEADQYSIFAGPVLSDSDNVFEGWSPNGTISVKIPEEFWKIVIFNGDTGLEAYGFLLKQSLKYVQWDLTARFEPTVEWNPYLISIADLEEKLVGDVTFSAALKAADKYTSATASVVLEESSLRRFKK